MEERGQVGSPGSTLCVSVAVDASTSITFPRSLLRPLLSSHPPPLPQSSGRQKLCHLHRLSSVAACEALRKAPRRARP
eukprot:scaffold7325_cov409-Pinguiococcus_pyrenoidosus.AAC.1